MQKIAPSHKVVLIRLTKSYPSGDQGTPQFAVDLYDATRRWWKIAAGRTTPGSGAPRYAFAVNKGVVQAVYEIDDWTRSPDGARFGFDGRLSDELEEQYRGSDVSHYFPPGAANPVRFVNCAEVAPVGNTTEELASAGAQAESERADYIGSLALAVNREPLAHIMFGGRELFHSNLLKWFADTMSDKASDVFDGLFRDPEEPERNYQGYVRRVDRERRKLDLAIWWDDNRTPLVIENKVFSLPDVTQLDRYSETILNDTELDSPRQVLLSLQDPQWDENTFDTALRVKGGGSWHRISYGALGERILEALRNEPHAYEVDIMRHYGQMVIDLQKLADAVVVRSVDEPVLLSDTMASGTAASIDGPLLQSLAKLRARSVQQVVQADIDRYGMPGVSESGFSNGTPVVSVFYPPTPGDNRVRVGWQLQSKDFRLAAVLKHVSGSSEAKRKARIEWGLANPRYFDFGVIDLALSSATLQEYPVTPLSAGGFNRYDPDFIYRAKKLPSITVAQLLTASKALADAHYTYEA